MAHSRLALFGEFCEAMKLALILILHGGGRSLGDMRMLANDVGLLSLLQMTAPSPDATGN